MTNTIPSLSPLPPLEGKLDLRAIAQRLHDASWQDLMQLSDEVQEEEEKKSRWLAWLLLAGLIGLGAWLIAMRKVIREHLYAQAALGSRGTVQPTRLDEALAKENAYLDRFARQIGEAEQAGKPMTADRVGNRAASYMGTGRGLFYSLSEETIARQRGNATWGMVAEYIATGGLGDENTCDPCFEAAKTRWFLPNTGPYPGSVCAGRARCRCRRVLRYLPGVWKMLQQRELVS